MFIETRSDTLANEKIKQTFVKSLNVQAFPCGRRRSDSNQVIPFDPEARLNTEANNRKHSGINGYTQTFLKSDWNTGTESSEAGLCCGEHQLFSQLSAAFSYSDL